ncbi:MAG TPA: hypothetical protein VMG12_11325, partial [Polyangiaceae bacterium]|nr:hypothetical protein [Polyangiaceae bacterium]
ALAIELAAMRVDVFGVGGLQRQLADRFRLLAGRRAGLERHRTLAATLDWSYGLLPPRDAAMLCAVSVFAGAFRVDDASAVANVPAAEAAPILAELAAQSLLATDADADAGELYRPLETTRAYGLEKLLASGEAESVRLRHAEHIGSVMQRAARDLGERTAREWSASYRRYLDELRAALAWAGADAATRPLLIRLTLAGTVLWNHFSLTEESRPYLERALAELREADEAGTALEMNLQLCLAGAVLYTRGMIPTAREAMARALDISVRRRDTESRLLCLRLIGTYELLSGELDAGNRTLETFLALAAAEAPSVVAEGETHLGAGEILVGRLGSARQRLERLYAHGLRDPSYLRFLHNNSVNILAVLSHAEWLTGSPDTAAQTAARGVEYGLEAKHELSLSIGLAWASLLYFWAGRDEECRSHGAMLDELVEKHGIVFCRPIATFCRGALASQHPHTLSQGVEDLERTVAECHALGHRVRLPYYLAVLAEALTRRGRLSEADATLHEALDRAARQNEQWCLPELLRIQAATLAGRRPDDERAALLLRSMSIAESIGAASWRLRAASDLARLWQAGGRTLEANRLLEPVFAAFSEGFATRDVAAAAQLLAELR